MPQEIVATYILSKPTGKYARRIWYLYEMMTGSRLPIEDLTQGNYVDLLDPDDYYTSLGKAVQRQRIRDNLLGDARFCPTIRRTQKIAQVEQSDLAERCRQIMKDYPLELLKRALSYLYTKESKSSFEIEHIKPTATRTERFVSLLQSAEKEDFFHKTALIETCKIKSWMNGLQTTITELTKTTSASPFLCTTMPRFILCPRNPTI